MDFNIPFKIMDRTLRQKLNKETSNLNNTTCRKNLTDINRTF